MTNAEVKRTLKELKSLIPNMDKVHVKKLLSLLIMGQKIESELIVEDVRKSLQNVVEKFIKSPTVNEDIDRDQMKQIYKIMGDYDAYPVCALCGFPIYVNSSGTKKQTGASFSWDHIVPKALCGSNDLSNMQPTHKLCNSRRGCQTMYHTHYTINIYLGVDTEKKETKKKSAKKSNVKPSKQYTCPKTR